MKWQLLQPQLPDTPDYLGVTFSVAQHTPGTKPIHKQSAQMFFLYLRGCEYRRDMYSTTMNSLKNLANMRKRIPQTYFPVFARVQIQAPHVFTQKIPKNMFPACIGFVPGGINLMSPQT